MAEYVVTADEKEDWEELAHALNKLAAIWAGGAVLLGATGAGAPAAVTAGVASAGFWYLSDVAGDIADDPPRPDYRKPVTLVKATPKLPAVRRPAFKAINRESQKVFRAIPAANAALEALEKYGGAVKAEEQQLARTHGQAALRFRRRAVKDIGLIRQDLTALSNRLKGTEVDVKVDQHVWKLAQREIRRRGLAPKTRSALRAAGLTPEQVKRYERWAARSYRDFVPPARLSYLLKMGRNILQRAERKLARRLK